jgi:hypothetical protein
LEDKEENIISFEVPAIADLVEPELFTSATEDAQPLSKIKGPT